MSISELLPLEKRDPESLLAAIVRSSDDAIIGKDRDGIITTWNPGAERLYGYAAEEILGQSIAKLIPRARAGEDDDILARVLAGRRVDHFETQRMRKDGSVVDVSLTVSPIVDGSGRITGVSAIARNITDRKRTQTALEEARLSEKQKRAADEATRAKSEFLAGMSHELRTPLNAIIGFSELLCDGKIGETEGERHEFLREIVQSGRHLRVLMDGILDLAKVEAGKMEFRHESIDLERLVADVCHSVAVLADPKQITLSAEVKPDVSRAVSDATKLKQILYNYIANAIEFTREGGRVWVRIEREDAEQFRIEVEDTGIGVTAENRPLLFNEFVQVHGGQRGQSKGTGLGLALVRRLVEAQNGSVGVEPADGGGSTFFAVLPGVGRETEPSSASVGTKPSRDRTILVVEDDTRDQAWIKGALSAAGYGVELARTGAEAIARARAQHFDMVTLDLVLPDMGGLEALYAVRREGLCPDVPFVIVTSTSEQKLPRALAVEDWIVKPAEELGLAAVLLGIGVLPGSGTVLVVDDDPASREIARSMIDSAGFEVIVASSGREALEHIGTGAPAAIVLDLLMPDMDGFELLECLRRLDGASPIPAVVWTHKQLDSTDYLRLRGSAQAVVSKATQSGEEATVLTDELDRSLIETVDAAFDRQRRRDGEQARKAGNDGGAADDTPDTGR
jgi:PAS domain S-box-containing protein